jgi:CheY-like chemotaxis protein
VLVVAAEASLHDGCRMALAAAGLQVAGAATALAALDWLRHQPPPSAIVLASGLPVLDQQILAAAVRAAFGAAVPLVLLAPAACGEQQARALRVATWVPTPLVPATLVQALRSVTSAG